MYIPMWLIVILCIIFIEPILSILFSLLVLGFYAAIFLLLLAIPIGFIYYINISKNDWLLWVILIPLIIFGIINGRQKNIEQSQNQQSEDLESKKSTFNKVRYLKNLKTNCPLYFKIFIKRRKNRSHLETKNHFDILREMNK